MCAINHLALRIDEIRREGYLLLFHQIQIEQNLVEFSNVQGACERIKNTPFLIQYDFFQRMFLLLFIIILPFGLTNSLGVYTIPLSFVISLTYATIEVTGLSPLFTPLLLFFFSFYFLSFFHSFILSFIHSFFHSFIQPISL